jgi:antitoxin VapB
VEKAVDGLLASRPDASEDDFEARALAILAQLDRIPDRPDAFAPIEWDDHGLPR